MTSIAPVFLKNIEIQWLIFSAEKMTIESNDALTVIALPQCCVILATYVR